MKIIRNLNHPGVSFSIFILGTFMMLLFQQSVHAFDINRVERANQKLQAPELVSLPDRAVNRVILSCMKVGNTVAGVMINRLPDPVASFRNSQGNSGSEDGNNENSILRKSIKNIYKSLIKKDMYIVILKGLMNTILISVFSGLLGIIMGVLICILFLSKNKAFNWIARIYVTILRGIPLLVLLLVCYYAIYALVKINPIIIAIIAFGINSGAFVSVMLKTSIEGIHKGQIEAGIACGFTRTQTYISIILPQLLQRLIPLYKNEFVAIIKMTSIVGFIAIEDLTKASDILRSQTLDSISPLILAAVIYFLITMFLTSLIGYIEFKINPERRRYRFKKYCIND